MNGPWIHQNILETIKNIKAKKITGGTKVDESDGFCAALPYFLFYKSEKELKMIIKSVANSKTNEIYALAKLNIIDSARKGIKILFKSLWKNIAKTKILKK